MRVAVLGMGNMGRAVAGRLLAEGYHVTVWNRTPGRVAEVIEAGAVEASSPAEAALGTEAVLMSLTDDRAVLEVMERLTGLGSAADTRLLADVPGTTATADVAEAPVVVDMSTISPDTSRILRDMAPGRRFLAAPIMGAPQAVLGGTASGLLGGDRGVADRLEPIWSRLFSAYWYCGEDPGSASTFKLLNNYLMMSGVAVVAEVVATAEAAGLDRTLLREALHRWPTVAPGLHNRLDAIIDGDHQGWFATRLGAKDVRLLAEVAESSGITPPIARLVQRRYEEAADQGWSEADITAVVELLRARRPA
ncbi:NAD(P)-dependent oxidoreductase [Sphaerisporangium perillae]|uniref:NAD(P)-dependent oxidoreductase n=1 Tax=Sphaerisporangium perillae TaxID=2935860 RepID=UPI00200FEA45|nr:NAD(P)-dependent oxidoreductase [Sphaerisporangium perillae]